MVVGSQRVKLGMQKGTCEGEGEDGKEWKREGRRGKEREGEGVAENKNREGGLLHARG